MATLSRFFMDVPFAVQELTALDEVTAKHVVQVLRMKAGEQIELTDGKGNIAAATIEQVAKKKCTVRIEQIIIEPAPEPGFHLAIAFTKNASRNEWLLEKATELGVTGIIPLSAQRSERERIRHDRWRNILISAMLQSQQSHLPYLAEPETPETLLQTHAAVPQKLVAHCMDGIKRSTIAEALQPAKNTLVMIGPEGDFTAEEVQQCIDAGCTGISMGSTRLRTETAAMAACVYFNMINHEKN